MMVVVLVETDGRAETPSRAIQPLQPETLPAKHPDTVWPAMGEDSFAIPNLSYKLACRCSADPVSVRYAFMAGHAERPTNQIAARTSYIVRVQVSRATRAYSRYPSTMDSCNDPGKV